MNEPLTPQLVNDLRAEFDQGHYIDWEAVVPYIALRTAAVVHVGDPDDRARSYVWTPPPKPAKKVER